MSKGKGGECVVLSVSERVREARSGAEPGTPEELAEERTREDLAARWICRLLAEKTGGIRTFLVVRWSTDTPRPFFAVESAVMLREPELGRLRAYAEGLLRGALESERVFHEALRERGA